MDLVIPNVKSILNLALTQVLGDSTKAQKILNTIGQCQNGSCQASLGYTTPIESIEQSLEALNLGSVDAQKFMLNGMTEKLKRTGLAAGFKHYRDINTANMLYQSIQQRNLQWASEGNIFLNAMRPMMAFIEGFFYAISPFAAIIILLGLFGLNIFFKYIMLLLWIQLWTPIMSIANLFIITSAKQALNPLTLTYTTAEDGGAISTYYYETIVQVCQDKIAVGSMMLAATPVLSLMIISGSVYAFTSLTNRIAGADHFNEKVLTPDIASAAPVMNQQSMFSGNQFVFYNNSKAQNQFNVGEGLSLEKSNSFSSMNALTDNINTTMEKIYSKNGVLSDSNSRAGIWNEMKASGNQEELARAVQHVKEYASSLGHTLSTTQAQDVALAAAGGKGAVGALSAREGKNSAVADTANNLLKDNRATAQSIKAQITSSVSSAFSNTYKNDDTYSETGTSSDKLSEQASKLKTTTNTYLEADKYSAHYGSDAKFNEYDIISNVVASKGELFYNGKFNDLMGSLTNEERKAVDDLARSLQRNDMSNDIHIGSYADQQYQLKALQQVKAGKAALFAARMMNEVGVGPNVSPLGNLFEKATTDNTEHAVGYDPQNGMRISNLADNTINTEQAAAQSSDAYKAKMVNDAKVDGIASTEKEKLTKEQEEEKNIDNGKSLDKGLLTNGYRKKVTFGDAVNPGTVLKEVGDAISSLVKQGFDVNYNNFADTYQRLHHSLDDKFKTVGGGRNEDLVDATKQMLILGEIASNGWATKDPALRDQQLEQYKTQATRVSSLVTQYAMSNIANEDGSKLTAEQATAAAGNFINSVNATIMTGNMTEFKEARSILIATR